MLNVGAVDRTAPPPGAGFGGSGARGFTLIELLVVITVIVVLLALLMPALDKAVYQAELTVCGAQIRGVASGAQAYAAGNGRAYPARPTIDVGPWKRPNNIYSSAAADDRPYLANHVPLKMLVDPFCQAIDLNPEANNPETQVFSTIPLWFGMRYPGGTAMRRLGDRLTWTDTLTDSSRAIPRRSSVLASDWDFPLLGSGVIASHADYDGKLHNSREQNEAGKDFGSGTGLTLVDGSYTLSRWVTRTPFDRGPIDTNYGFSDGSVRRFLAVELDEPQRMARAPYNAAGDYAHYAHLPVE